MNAFLFALEIQPCKLGETYRSLPLHCTLMHWFRTTVHVGDIVRLGKECTKKRRPITLVYNQPAYFGKNHDTLVDTVLWNQDLLSFHSALYQALNGIGVTHLEPQYVGGGYRPHVTRQGADSLRERESCVVDHLYIAEALNAENPTNKKIHARIKLG